MGKVFEAVLTQVPDFYSFGQVLRHERMRGVGRKSLPPVSHRSDASSPVHINPHIAGLPGEGLACLESDAELRRDPVGPWMGLYNPLCRCGGKQAIPSPRKDREHGIALGLHHLTLGFADGGAE